MKTNELREGITDVKENKIPKQTKTRSEEVKKQHRASAVLGARTVKTSIAVISALFISQHIPYSLPLLAAVAAVICMQPSITAGVQKGLIRIKGTVIGGLLGLALLYLFEANLLLIGAAVIVVICICRWLNLEEGISLASISIIAVMAQVSADAFPYAIGRVISTIIGILIATFINIAVAPPRHKTAFQDKMRQITISFPHLYETAIEAYTLNRPDLADRALEDLEEAEAEVENLQRELNHLKIGTQTPLGMLLEDIGPDEYLLFDRGVHFLTDVTGNIKNIIVAAQRCYEKKVEFENDKDSYDPDPLASEFYNLIVVLRDLGLMIGSLHQLVFNLIGEYGTNVAPEIQQKIEKINVLRELARRHLKYWQVKFIEEIDMVSLISAHRVIFDLEEIAIDLIDLAEVVVKSAESKEKEVKKAQGG